MSDTLHTQKLIDEYGNEIEGTMTNALKVAELTRLAGGVYNGTTPDTNFYTSTLSGGATATISNSELDLATSTTSGSSAEFATSSLARYMGANMNQYRSVRRFSAGATNNVRRWGVMDLATAPQNGFYFKLSNTTFSVCRMLAGVETKIDSGSFNGNGSKVNQSYSLDLNYHTFEIYYTNRKVMFVIDSVPIHTITATTTPLTGTKHLRGYASNINTGVGSVTHIYSESMTVSRFGKPTSQPKYYFQQGQTAGVVLKTGPGSLHSLNISGVTNNSVVTVYDNTAASGAIIYSTGSMSNSTIPLTVPLDGDGGVQFQNGLTLVITTANSNCLVRYE